MGVCARTHGGVCMCGSVHACRRTVWLVCTRVWMSALRWPRNSRLASLE